MLYDVHMYPVVRITVKGVEAESQLDAIRKANANIDLYQAVCEAEYAEDVTGYLVDEHGDPDHLRTRCYKWDGDEILPE
jgi:hypothetical protein